MTLRDTRSVVMVGAVLLSLAACLLVEQKSDLPKRLRENRWIEPRVRGFSAWQSCRKNVTPDRLIDEVQCVQPPKSLQQPCVGSHGTRDDAILTLLLQPACTDDAVRRLEELSDSSATALSDLSAAYLARAQRQDRASDLLRAHDAAHRALEKDPRLPEARFNLALAEESLGLNDEAIRSWDAVRKTSEQGWSDEAAAHHRLLMREATTMLATALPLNKARVTTAAASDNQAAVAALIAPYPATVHRYIEGELLPEWARLQSQRRTSEARRQLALSRTIAVELAHTTGDRYLLDVIGAIERASESRMLATLQEGHIAFADAQRASQSFDINEAKAQYQRSARAFAKAGSPAQVSAELGLALADILTYQTSEATTRLQFISKEVRMRRYESLSIRADSTGAFLLIWEGRYTEALSSYDALIRRCEHIHDLETLTNIRVRRAGIFRLLGQEELALREALLAQRHLRLLDLSQRHLALRETAMAVVALGFPRIALLYQNTAIRMIGDESTRNVEGNRAHMAIALRGRAVIYLHLADYQRALADINDATPLTQSISDNERKVLLARIKEVEGQALLAREPARAASTFSAAIGLVPSGSYGEYRANLLMQRAAAYTSIGQRKDALEDTREALQELRAREAELLSGHQRGSRSIDAWTSYFDRSEEVYEQLVLQLAGSGRIAEALSYAERARATDAVNLPFTLGVDPKELVRFVDVTPPDIARVQSLLPPGHVLLIYFVAADRTLTWVVSRDRLELVQQRASRNDIDRWLQNLQTSLETHDRSRFHSVLAAASAALVAVPLKRVSALVPAGGERTLIIVPDGPMNGLPFAALPTQAKRYLIQDFTVTTTGSATQYAFSVLRARELSKAPRAQALVVGDPAFQPASELARGLDQLPFARLEVTKVGELYAPHAQVLPNDVGVQEFLVRAKSSTIIHFAGHAILNAHAPLQSVLLLTPSAGDSGMLSVEQLLAQKALARANLVVLSGCGSSGRLPADLTALAPVARSFLGAGVPATIGSLWSPNDAGAERLLVAFHRHYRNGKDAPRALRLAQLEMLGRDDVISWAAFQVFGVASSSFASTDASGDAGVK